MKFLDNTNHGEICQKIENINHGEICKNWKEQTETKRADRNEKSQQQSND